jgi:acyl-CoA synthetase (AMP-forming)/AMP-acid ligase II
MAIAISRAAAMRAWPGTGVQPVGAPQPAVGHRRVGFRVGDDHAVPPGRLAQAGVEGEDARRERAGQRGDPADVGERDRGDAGALRGVPAEPAAHCARELPAFAVPRYVEVVPSLPLTETGKVRKATLRQRGVTQDTWDRAADRLLG